MSNHFLPKTAETFRLPLRILAVGETSAERHVRRKNGYPAYHCMLCREGKGVLTIDGTDYTVDSPAVFFLRPRQPHAYHPMEGKWHTCWVVFDGENAEEMLSQLGFLHNAPMPLPRDSTVFLTFRQLLRRAEEKELSAHYKCSGLFYSLLLELAAGMARTAPENAAMMRIEPVLAYIAAHWAEPVGLDDFAAVLGVTPQYLCRLFKEALAVTPYEYLLAHRLQRAKEMLADPDRTVKDISLSAGFHDASYFCGVFKKQEGFSPARFRELFYG